MSDEIPVCPECDHAQIGRRTDAPDGGLVDKDWWCRDCESRFDEPTYRESKRHRPVNRGLAARLDDDLEPGDLVSDGGSGVYTDGTARPSAPLSKISGTVGRGAVLYDVRIPERRPCCHVGGRCLGHVRGVYEETTTGTVYYRVADGTHTTEQWIHQDDLLELYEPAGWSFPSQVKPTYVLTRRHGVEDHHDLIADGGECSVYTGTDRSGGEQS